MADDTRPPRFQTVSDPWDLMDTARFEHMLRWAQMMAKASVLPDHLKVFRRSDNDSVILDIFAAVKDDRALKFYIDLDATIGNCALIVTQAVQWRVHPFLLAQATYVTRGKIGYTGAMIQSIIERECGNVDVTIDGAGEQMTATIEACRPGDGKRVGVTGSFAEWATKNKDGNAWKISDQWGGGKPEREGTRRKMMRYRGVREWAREHAPGLMLGVMSDDELEGIREDYAARRAIEIPSAPPQQALTHAPVESIIPEKMGVVDRLAPEVVEASRAKADQLNTEHRPSAQTDMSSDAANRIVHAYGVSSEEGDRAMMEHNAERGRAGPDWGKLLEELHENLTAAQNESDAKDCLDNFAAQGSPPGNISVHATNFYDTRVRQLRDMAGDKVEVSPSVHADPPQAETTEPGAKDPADVGDAVPSKDEVLAELRKAKTVADLATIWDRMVKPYMKPDSEEDAFDEPSFTEMQDVAQQRKKLLGRARK